LSSIKLEVPNRPPLSKILILTSTWLISPLKKLVSSFITSKKKSKSLSSNWRTFQATLQVSQQRHDCLGEVPPHLHKLKGELERIYESLEKKNELLMAAMMKNFGRTQ
jgi:hypothetical protein